MLHEIHNVFYIKYICLMSCDFDRDLLANKILSFLLLIQTITECLFIFNGINFRYIKEQAIKSSQAACFGYQTELSRSLS